MSKKSLTIATGIFIVAGLSLSLTACAPTEQDRVSKACEWYNKGSDALSADATNALVYFQKSADEFQALADENPDKYADAYAMAIKWASGTGFNAGDITNALALNKICNAE